MNWALHSGLEIAREHLEGHSFPHAIEEVNLHHHHFLRMIPGSDWYLLIGVGSAAEAHLRSNPCFRLEIPECQVSKFEMSMTGYSWVASEPVVAALHPD